jgi:hypothetical protein
MPDVRHTWNRQIRRASEVLDTLLLSPKLHDKLSQPSHGSLSDRLGYATLRRTSDRGHLRQASFQ